MDQNEASRILQSHPLELWNVKGMKPKLQVVNLSDFCNNFFQLGKKI